MKTNTPRAREVQEAEEDGAQCAHFVVGRTKGKTAITILIHGMSFMTSMTTDANDVRRCRRCAARSVYNCRNPSLPLPPSLLFSACRSYFLSHENSPRGRSVRASELDYRRTDGPEQIRQTAAAFVVFTLLSLISPLALVRFPDLHLLPVPCALHQQCERRTIDFPSSVRRGAAVKDAEVNNSSANPIRSQSVQSVCSAIFATAANHYFPPLPPYALLME